jgi:hypothetical protein
VRLYIESNFVLEIALGQEQAAAARQLLLLAVDAKVELVFPLQAVSEPFSKIGYLAASRRQLIQQLRAQAKELSRSYHPVQMEAEEQSRELVQRLEALDDAELHELQFAVRTVLKHGRQLSFDHETFTSGEHEHLRSLRRHEQFPSARRLKLPDALVFSAIWMDLERTPAASIFATRDDGFRSLKPDLADRGCSLITNFDHALQRIRAEGSEEK